MVLKGTFNFGRFAVVIVNHTKPEQSIYIFIFREYLSLLCCKHSRFKKTCISFGSINSTPVRSFSVVILEENKVIKPAHTLHHLIRVPTFLTLRLFKICPLHLALAVRTSRFTLP